MEAPALDFVKQSYHDNRSILKKSTAHAMSLLRELDYGYELIPAKIADSFRPKYDFVDREKSWKAASLGLYVLVHGLNGHPACWDHHLKLINNHIYDVLVPYLPMKGNGPLEAYAEPVFRLVDHYVKQHPAKPVCLIGVSNGARVCMWIETKLRSSSPATPIKVSTIAAVHFGSSRMHLIKKINTLTGLRFGYHPAIIEDLCLESENSKQLMGRVRQPLPDGVSRIYEFFSSTEDIYVPEFFSSHPTLPHQTIHHVMEGYNHNSIVKGVSLQQIQSSEKWMNEFFCTDAAHDQKITSTLGFQRGEGFWSSPAQENSTQFFTKLTLPGSQRENWYQVTPYIAEFWCTISNLGFIAAGIHGRSPELLFAGLASILSHSIPKQWLLSLDKIGVLVVLFKLARQYPILIENPKLCVSLGALGAINLFDAHMAHTHAKTWPHVVWHLSAAAVATLIQGYSK